MGAIQSLKAWWNRIAVNDDLEPWDGKPSPDQAREEAKALKKLRSELHIWTLTTFNFLGSEIAERLSRRIRRETSLGDSKALDAANALRDGLIGDFFKGGRAPFVFLFDAGYTEDAEKIFNKVCNSYGINAYFRYEEATQGALPPSVLRNFKGWLIERSFDLIIFDTGGDEYCGFVIPLDILESALAGLKVMGVKATNIPEEC